MALQILLISIVALVPGLIIPGFAEDHDTESGISVQLNKYDFKIGQSLTISGSIEERKMPIIAISIFDPKGKIISANQVDIEMNNTFSKVISLDSPFYDKIGSYLVEINYGKLKTFQNFEISQDTIDSPPDPIVDSTLLTIPEILVLTTDKVVYHDNDTIVISGIVSEKVQDSILLAIYDPYGSPTGFYFADVTSDLEFNVPFLAKSDINFKIEGTFSVTAFYGESENTIFFDFKETDEFSGSEIVPEEPGAGVEKEQPDETPVVNLPTPDLENEGEIGKKDPKDEQSFEQSKTGTTIAVKKPIIEKNVLPKNYQNLKVKNAELGIILNQIDTKCGNEDYVDVISYFDGMGPALIRLCKYEEAIFYYDQSLKNNPDNIEILTNKGSALNNLGYYNEAIVFYDSVLDIDPNYVHALNNKANVLAILGYYDESISLYNQVLAVDDNNLITLNNLEKAQRMLEIKNKDNLDYKPGPQTLIEEKPFNILENKENENHDSPNLLAQIGNTLFSISKSILGFFN